jgi:hypothetical protein
MSKFNGCLLCRVYLSGVDAGDGVFLTEADSTNRMNSSENEELGDSLRSSLVGGVTKTILKSYKDSIAAASPVHVDDEGKRTPTAVPALTLSRVKHSYPYLYTNK